jgi:hypothetical protein
MVAELRGLLNEWDPIGVFHSGIENDCPSDEYDCLHGLVLGSLRRGDPVDEKARLLDEELREHFGLPMNRASCRVEAERLHQWYRSRGDDPGKA